MDRDEILIIIIIIIIMIMIIIRHNSFLPVQRVGWIIYWENITVSSHHLRHSPGQRFFVSLQNFVMDNIRLLHKTVLCKGEVRGQDMGQV